MTEAQPRKMTDVVAACCPLCLGAGAVAIEPRSEPEERRWVIRTARKLLKFREKHGIAPVQLYRKEKPKKMGDALWKGKQKEEPPIMTEAGDVVVEPDGKTPYKSRLR